MFTSFISSSVIRRWKLSSSLLLAALLVPVGLRADKEKSDEVKKGVEAEAQPTPTPKAAPKAAPKKRIFRPVPPPKEFSPPVLHIEEPAYDWGTALQGEVIKHSFVIQNKGGSALRIVNVKPSCGCTTVGKPTEPIEPGKTDVVTLQIDTKKFTGAVNKTASVRSNASTTQVKLTMKGSVDPFFEVDPKAPKVHIVRGGTSEPLKVKLRKKTEAEFTIKGITTESKVLTANLVEVEKGKLYEVELQANSSDDDRKYYYENVQVDVEANGKDFKIPIRVSVAVKNRIDVQPRTSVYFGRKDTQKLAKPDATPLTKILEVQSLGGPEHTFKVTNVSNKNPTFETKLETVEDGRHYRLTVSMSELPTATKARTIRDTILIETDDPTVKELKISALAAVQ